MYELFILGELADKPMHGYLLHSILTSVLGPLRPVSWGSLYPILKRLEDEGAIEQVVSEESGPGRTKKVYRITPIGRERFMRLMAKPLEHHVDAEDIFRIKVSKFHLVELAVRLEILWQYKVFLELLRDGMDLTEKRVQDEPCISGEERPYILAAIDYDRVSYDARIQWVEQQISLVTENGQERTKP